MPILMLGFLPVFLFIMAALLPAIILLRYIYKQDTIEKEPPRLLFSLLLLGVLAGFLSMILETVGTHILDASTLSASRPLYTVATAFLVVAVVEEGTKYVLMMIRTWYHPAFNFRFDGIVYSVFVSLGFAAMENLLYEIGYGSGIMLSRALLAIPAHMGFAVLNGVFYGRAKMHANQGRGFLCVLNLAIGYLLAVLLHGMYDTCAMLSTSTASLVFLLVVVVIYFIVFRVVRHESRTDERISDWS